MNTIEITPEFEKRLHEHAEAAAAKTEDPDRDLLDVRAAVFAARRRYASAPKSVSYGDGKVEVEMENGAKLTFLRSTPLVAKKI